MKDGREQRDRGLTLVEVSAVLLIMAVLMGIAIPTFRGARHQDADRTAQVNLLRAYSAARTALADDGTFEKATHQEIVKIEPDLKYKRGAGRLSQENSTASNEISISVTGMCSLPYVEYQVDDGIQSGACAVDHTWDTTTSKCTTKARRLTQKWCTASGVWDAALDHTVWAAAVLSDSGKCFLLRHQIADLDAGIKFPATTSTTIPQETKYATLTNPDDCDGDNAADPDVTDQDEW